MQAFFASPLPLRVAVVGAGIAGSACAAALRRGGLQVQVFDKSRGVGGRMATRRARWSGDGGVEQQAEFDHGAHHFSARSARFKAMMAGAVQAGAARPWTQRVHAPWPADLLRAGFVATPGMPSLSRYLLGDETSHLGQAVQALQHEAGAAAPWTLQLDDGSRHGPFEHLVLALPPAQAAALLAPVDSVWAAELASVRMNPCWTLMAATDDCDWPWDAAEPAAGANTVLARVSRNDRAPARTAPAGRAHWVAQATAAWSQAHLEDEAGSVQTALLAALARLLPGAVLPKLHFSSVHRWRYAGPAAAAPDRREFWWQPERGLGLCGDYLAGGGVEAAWRSGDELADTVLAALEARSEAENQALPA